MPYVPSSKDDIMASSSTLESIIYFTEAVANIDITLQESIDNQYYQHAVDASRGIFFPWMAGKSVYFSS